MTEPVLTCPECGSDRVTTEHHQMFMVNTSEHYCHSVKTHDADSPAICEAIAAQALAAKAQFLRDMAVVAA